MRPKTLKLVVTFHTTAAAMAMESPLQGAESPRPLDPPLPGELTADCGMAWCAPLDAGETLRALADAHHLEYADWRSCWSEQKPYLTQVRYGVYVYKISSRPSATRSSSSAFSRNRKYSRPSKSRSPASTRSR